MSEVIIKSLVLTEEELKKLNNFFDVNLKALNSMLNIKPIFKSAIKKDIKLFKKIKKDLN